MPYFLVYQLKRFEKKLHKNIYVKHLYNICTTSAQCLRHWSNIVQMLYKCFVFAG